MNAQPPDITPAQKLEELKAALAYIRKFFPELKKRFADDPQMLAYIEFLENISIVLCD